MKLWYRFVCAFVAVVVVLFSVCVPDVDAEDVVIDGKLYKGFIEGFNYSSEFYQLYDEYRDEIFDVDDFIDFSGFCFHESNSSYDYYYIFGVYQHGSTIDATFVPLIDESTGLYNITCTGSYYDAEHSWNNQCIIRLSIFKQTGAVSFWSNPNIEQSYFYNSNNDVITWNSETMLSNIDKYRSSSAVTSKDISSCQLIPFGSAWDNSFKRLTFSINPELSDSMDMNNFNTNFTVNVENKTDNAYNYCIYISSQPASVGIVNSLQSANYFLSSKQWCYVFQQDYQLDADLLDQIRNNVSDNYTTTDILDYMLMGAPITNLSNVWGGVYNGAKEYIALKNNSMSFYSLVQTNCPVYLIRSNSNRSHVVDYASLNVNLNTQYYLNIIYYKPDMNIVGAIGSSTASLVSAATGEDMIYPIYNVDFFRDYMVYDSIPFSFVNGTFSISEDDVTKYNDVVQNSNPVNSTANISSDDDNVNINNSNSYDSSVKTNYYNYGTIYHNCSWSGSGSGSGGSSGARPSVPELPEAEFENLYDQSGNFFDFVADVLDAVGAVPALFIAAAFAVLLFLRIWGR